MKISVIIPVYNCESYIAQVLDNICTQTIGVADIEVIICLDKPTDNTWGVIDKWMHENSEVGLRLHIIENDENIGPAASRNRAVAVATGEFVHFMDADDLINTDFYATMYNAAVGARADLAVCSFQAESRPEISVVFTNQMVISNLQDKIDETRADRYGYVWRYLIRRDFWTRKNFAFPENMRFCED